MLSTDLPFSDYFIDNCQKNFIHFSFFLFILVQIDNSYGDQRKTKYILKINYSINLFNVPTYLILIKVSSFTRIWLNLVKFYFYSPPPPPQKIQFINLINVCRNLSIAFCWTKLMKYLHLKQLKTPISVTKQIEFQHLI